MRKVPTCLLMPVAALAALGLVAAGCGGGNKKSSSNTTSAPKTTGTTPAGGGATLAETATDFKFSQPKPSAKSGAVTVNLDNKGQTPHAIEVEGHGVEKRTGTVGPGQSTTLKVKLKPGKYEFYCPVDGHKQLGMKGELTVR